MTVACACREKLPSKAAADAIKKLWTGYFDRLGQLLS